MNIQKGSIVRAKSGRDKGKFFLVLSVEGHFAFIADGKTRKLENRKTKNLLHLAATAVVYTDSAENNMQLKRM